MSRIRACPICGKAFRVADKNKTCSPECASAFSCYNLKQRMQLAKAAEANRRPPLTDCKMYHDSGCPTCTGLTGLWCEWEECKFYKPKFMKKSK